MNDNKVANVGETVYLDRDADFSEVTVRTTDQYKTISGTVLDENLQEHKVKETEAPVKEEIKEEITPEPVQEVKASPKVEQVQEMLKEESTKEKEVRKEDIPLEISEEDIEKEVSIDLDQFEGDFATEEAALEPQEEETVKTKAKKIDISALNITNSTEIDKERDLKNALYGNKGAFQIVAAQSGYMAKVLPLVHKDTINLLYSTLSRYEYRKNVYKVVWEKIFDTSVGRMKFEDWLRVTSVEDMETFYYGVYCSTFPNQGTFNFTCPKCGKSGEYKVKHRNLVKTTDRDKMKQLMEEVSRNATTVEKMMEYSLIGKNEAIILSQSGLVVELRTPTLFDSLEILRTVPEETIDKDTLSVTNMLYIKRVLIPSKGKEVITYTEEYDRQSILRIIDNLPIDDAKELEDAVYNRVDENRLMYSIKKIKCTECGHEVNDIPVSIEDILFTLIFEKTQ